MTCALSCPANSIDADHYPVCSCDYGYVPDPVNNGKKTSIICVCDASIDNNYNIGYDLNDTYICGETCPLYSSPINNVCTCIAGYY